MRRLGSKASLVKGQGLQAEAHKKCHVGSTRASDWVNRTDQTDRYGQTNKTGLSAVDERNTPCPELEIASGASEPVINSIKPEAAFSLY